MPVDIDLASLTPVPSPQHARRHIRAGIDTNASWLDKVAAGDLDRAVATVEQSINVYDATTARDVEFSVELTTFVVELDSEGPTQTTFSKKTDAPGYGDDSSPEWVNTWWRAFGGGGGAGRGNLCQGFHGGRTSMYNSGFGSMTHEMGHVFDLGHYHNGFDAMHSNRDLLVDENALKVRNGYLATDDHACLESDNEYTDPLHPRTNADAALTGVDESTLIDVLANDWDANPEQALQVVEVDATSHYGGTAIIESNQVRYVPPAGFRGRDQFNYWAEDDDGLRNYAQARVYVRDEGLALHYTFDAPKGPRVYNRAGSDGELHGMLSYVTLDYDTEAGIVGRALALPESGGGLATPDVLDPVRGELSISLWFYLDSVPEEKTKYLLVDSGSAGSLNAQGLSVSLNADGIAYHAQPQALDGKGVSRFIGQGWSTGVWHHAVLVVDRQQQNLRGYLDGVPATESAGVGVSNFEASATIKGYPARHGRTGFTIGNKASEKPVALSAMRFHGRIDEVKVYTYALSADEIDELHESPGEPDESCFDGLSSAPVFDPSFEDPMIYPAGSVGLTSSWFAVTGNHDTVTEAHIAVPETPYGYNWAEYRGNDREYHHIGNWSENTKLEVTLLAGARDDYEFGELEFSVWAGGAAAPRKGRSLDDVGATKLASHRIAEGSVAAGETDSIALGLDLGSGLDACDPLWLEIAYVGKNSQRSLLDNLELTATRKR